MFHGQASEPVSCVVPAYNEEKHIGSVLEALSSIPDFTKIVVVDDSSTDRTAEVVEAFCDKDPRIHLLRLPVNRGKGGAMVEGAACAGTDLIVFLDADLVGLSRGHVAALVEPVVKGECNMTLGIFTHGRIRTDWSHRITPFLSGQRCIKWSDYRNAPELNRARYGVEVALNLHAWHKKYRIKSIEWPGATHVMKPEKVGRFQGMHSYFKMYREIGIYVLQHALKDKSLCDAASMTQSGKG
jgi:glycosyltransferase involved in cell wall biosynthesis